MSATVTLGGPTGLIEDGSRSPRWSFSNGIECRRSFTGTMEECLAVRLFRGQIPIPPFPVVCVVPGSAPTLFVQVWDCDVSPIGGGKGRIDFLFAAAGGVAQNGVSGYLPPTDVWIQPKQFDISLQFHPRYKDLLGLTTDLCEKRLAAIDTLLGLKVTDSTRNHPDLKFIYTEGQPNYNRDVHQLYLKMRSGMSHYWEEYPVLYQRQYYWTLPGGLVGRGGIEYPAGVFPGDLPSGLVWKRMADWPSFDGRRGYWTVERKWVGALSWDDLYE